MNSVLKSVVMVAVMLVSTSVFAQKNKGSKNTFLEGKKFNVNFYELRAGNRGKAIPSKVLIKSGKVEADLMYEKLQMEPITYVVTLDSTYTEDDTEMHMVTFEATNAADKNEYKWEVTVINYDIEGTVTVTKAGVEKKKYEFSGSEKTKK
jgi:hypothetical protein